MSQRASPPPTQQVTRPPTEGSELPSPGLALPRPICNDTGAEVTERGVTPQRKDENYCRKTTIALAAALKDGEWEFGLEVILE